MRQLSSKVSALGATQASALLALALLIALLSASLEAHGVTGKDAVYLQGLQGRAIGPLMYLGAKHMVTGYDHLLFLVGVIFFLYRLKDVVMYVSLFTVGHSLTLLAGVLGGIRANPFLIDAIIGFSVVYKAFENMDGFKRFLGVQPNTRVAVLIFGLFHGFGLATKLQELDLARDGLLPNMIAFNVGVEIGQLLALTAILLAMNYWRRTASFTRHAYAANVALLTAGFILTGFQLTGYAVAA
jgi:HupE / UreJ protein